jgi:aspartate 1-decarboxylase
MLVNVLRGKLHQARVTRCDLDYEGSMGISRELMQAAGFVPYERILCADLENAARWETYVIPLVEPGQIFVNGACAHLCNIGDRLIIMSWAQLSLDEARTHQPRTVRLDEANRPLE